MVSWKTTPAVELSYLTPEEQEDFLSYMESEGCTPSLSQAQKLKEASKESVLTPEKNPAYHVGQAAQRKAARTAAYDSCFGNRAIFPQGIQQ